MSLKSLKNSSRLSALASCAPLCFQAMTTTTLTSTQRKPLTLLCKTRVRLSRKKSQPAYLTGSQKGSTLKLLLCSKRTRTAANTSLSANWRTTKQSKMKISTVKSQPTDYKLKCNSAVRTRTRRQTNYWRRFQTYKWVLLMQASSLQVNSQLTTSAQARNLDN